MPLFIHITLKTDILVAINCVVLKEAGKKGSLPAGGGALWGRSAWGSEAHCLFPGSPLGT